VIMMTAQRTIAVGDNDDSTENNSSR